MWRGKNLRRHSEELSKAGHDGPKLSMCRGGAKSWCVLVSMEMKKREKKMAAVGSLVFEGEGRSRELVRLEIDLSDVGTSFFRYLTFCVLCLALLIGARGRGNSVDVLVQI